MTNEDKAKKDALNLLLLCRFSMPFTMDMTPEERLADKTLKHAIHYVDFWRDNE